MVFKTLLVTSALVGIAVTLVIAVQVCSHALLLSVRRRRSVAVVDLAVQIGTVVGGAVGLWLLLEHIHARTALLPSLPSFFKVSVVLLYLAGCLVYAEIGALVTRGYSLRILVDLLERGDAVDIARLKAEYGGGMGIRGLLIKRLNHMGGLGLIHVEGDRVGPLTSSGRFLTEAGASLRRLLRLDQVG